MSRYILEGFGSDELEQSLRDSRVFPLVRDLCHKFGLKVLAETEERLKSKILEREKANDECEKTEKYLKNLDCVAQLVGEVI